MWDYPFSLEKIYAPVLSGPKCRPCIIGLIDKSQASAFGDSFWMFPRLYILSLIRVIFERKLALLVALQARMFGRGEEEREKVT